MESPQFKNGNVEILNEKISLYELRKIDLRSLIGLYLSQALLYLGFLLILLNNLGVLESGSYFGALNWLTISVFSIGIMINFLSIPWLYLSSFKDFKRENDFWDKEIFWILPLFFFGTFFLYESNVNNSFRFFVTSLLIITIVHTFFIYSAYRLKRVHANDFCNHQQYAMTLKYLSAYYVILVTLLVMYNPLQHMFVWIRTNF